MKIQLALDDITLDEGLELCAQVIEHIDIIEVGTPMIIEYGVEAIRKVREKFPDILITADPKIMDAGEYEALQCFNAGADIVTVMGVTHDSTFEGALKAAKSVNGSIMADMMAVENLKERAIELHAMGVHYITVHTAVDIQKHESPYESLRTILEVIPSNNTGIAGGVSMETINRVTEMNPEIVIVGSGISKQDNPKEAAQKIRKLTNL